MDLAGIGLFVDSSGAVRGLREITREAGKTSTAVDRLKGIVAGVAGFFSARQLIEYADTWQLINSRIRVVTSSQEQANAVQERLYNISQKTRNRMEASSVLYTRLALNADQLGRSHEDILNVVSSVNSAMLITGATGVEAAQSMRQLAQALGSGRVQGDEFRTMIEAMPVVARAVADQMGVAVGDLYKLSAAGKISVQTTIDALLAKQKEFEEQARNMPMTIAQSFTIFGNAAERMIGIMSQTTGAGNAIAKTIVKLADNMDRAISIIVAATAAWVAYRVALMAAHAMTMIATAANVIKGLANLARGIQLVGLQAAAVQGLGKNIAGIAGAVLGAAAGVGAYLFMMDQLNKATEEWTKNQADLTAKLGDGVTTPGDATDYSKQRNEMEDMVLLAKQKLVLSQMDGRTAERTAIVFDAINKKREAGRDKELVANDELYQNYLRQIDAERDILLLAESAGDSFERQKQYIVDALAEFERFRDNVQRGLGDVFNNAFTKGLSSFSKFFDAVKRMFFRMLADIAASHLVKGLESTFKRILNTNTGSHDLGFRSDAVRAGRPYPEFTGKSMESAQQEMMEMPLTGLLVPVEIKRADPSFSDKLSSKMAQYLAPALAGFAAGSAVGGMTTNKGLGTLGGAAAGAAAGFAVGGPIGAGIGALTGAIGGLMGSMAKEKAEREAQRKAIAQNTAVLQNLRDAIEGKGMGSKLADVARIMDILVGKGKTNITDLRKKGDVIDTGLVSNYDLILEIAESLGLNLDAKGSFEAIIEAVRLATIHITQFGNNLTDLQSKQEAYNKLFDVEESPAQALKDSFAILNQMAPKLMQQLGLTNLDPDSEAGRKVMLEGLRDVYELISSGKLTPELLGAFTDKNQLLDSILKVKDGLDKFHAQLYDVTTDFPRAMDLIFYQQKFGTYNQNTAPPTAPPTATVNVPSTIRIDKIEVTTNSGEELLAEVEYQAYKRATRGGTVDLPAIQ